MNIFMRTPNISQMNNLVWSSQSCQSHQSLNLFLSFVLLWAAFSQWSFSFTAFASSSSYPLRRLSPPVATLRSSANRLVGDELFFHWRAGARTGTARGKETKPWSRRTVSRSLRFIQGVTETLASDSVMMYWNETSDLCICWFKNYHVK